MTQASPNPWLPACAGGALAALVVHGLFALAARPESAPAAPMAATAEPTPDTLAPTVRQLAEQLEALRNLLATNPPPTPPNRTPTAPAPVVVDEQVLVAAWRRMRQLDEQERLATLTDTELFHEAERLMHAGAMDRLGCRRLLQTLLQRPLQPGMRSNARMLLAQVQADLGELTAAASSLRQVVDELGLHTEEGARAGNQLALLAVRTKDWASGIAIADEVARVAPLPLAFEARWGAALLLRNSGDAAKARAAFTRLVADCEGRPEVDYVAAMCRRQLEDMDR